MMVRETESDLVAGDGAVTGFPVLWEELLVRHGLSSWCIEVKLVCVFSCKTARNSFYGCDRTIDSVARAKARGKGTKKTEKTNEPAAAVGGEKRIICSCEHQASSERLTEAFEPIKTVLASGPIRSHFNYEQALEGHWKREAILLRHNKPIKQQRISQRNHIRTFLNFGKIDISRDDVAQLPLSSRTGTDCSGGCLFYPNFVSCR
jgi:hypothetical protein